MFRESSITGKQLSLYRSLFKGREDVFAIHWQKGNKGGYMPAYEYDPYMYRLHKMKGGTFKNYEDKTYLPFTDQQLIKYLNGQQLVGIYPLTRALQSGQAVWQESSILIILSTPTTAPPAFLNNRLMILLAVGCLWCQTSAYFFQTLPDF